MDLEFSTVEVYEQEKYKFIRKINYLILVSLSAFSILGFAKYGDKYKVA